MKLIRKKMLTLYQKICAELDENKSPENFALMPKCYIFAEDKNT